MGRAEATDVRATVRRERRRRPGRPGCSGHFLCPRQSRLSPPHSTGMGRIGAEFAQEPLDTAYLYWRMLSLALSDRGMGRAEATDCAGNRTGGSGGEGPGAPVAWGTSLPSAELLSASFHTESPLSTWVIGRPWVRRRPCNCSELVTPVSTRGAPPIARLTSDQVVVHALRGHSPHQL